MAIERIIMAEGTTGPGSEGVSQGQPTPDSSRSIAEQLSKIPYRHRVGYVMALPESEQEKGWQVLNLEIAGGAIDVPDWLKDAANQPSRFQDVSGLVGLLSKADRSKLTPEQQASFDTMLAENTTAFNELVSAPLANNVLAFVRDDIRRIYTEATAKQPTGSADSESFYGSASTPKTLEDRLSEVHKALGKDPKTGSFNYEEIFWDYGQDTLRRAFGDVSAEELQQIKAEYAGLASHMAAATATAIDKELRDQDLSPTELGDSYLLNIKKELEDTRGGKERARREERKRATAEERLKYNDWREKFNFSWAETAEELRDSIYDWLDYFQQQLPQEAEDKVYESINTGIHNALASLEQARNRLRIPAESAVARELRETLEGHVAIIGGARLLESRDGFDGYIKLRTDFATNYNGHTDRVYLKRGSAIMADRLSENAGEIYKGGPKNLKKPLPGHTKTFRGELEDEAIKYGATHQLYITESDFENAELGEREIVKEVARLNLSTEAARDRVSKVMAERRRVGEKGGRYGWEDGIEALLLGDSRGLAKAQELTDPLKRAEAIARIKARTGVFRKIKNILDQEDGLYGKTQDERKDIIRQKIKDKIAKEGNTILLQRITALADQAAQDRALWKWVKDYNKPRIELRREGSIREPWFPSLWDAERLSIDRPEGLVDRVLSQDEFKAMVEEIEDPYKGLTNEQIQSQIKLEFSRRAAREVDAKKFSPEETEKRLSSMRVRLESATGKVPTNHQVIEALRKEDINILMGAKAKDINTSIEKVLFERKQRETEAERNYNINRAHDKFLGLEARWGGLTTRVVNEEGKLELRTVYSLAEEILKAKIDIEAAEVEASVAAWKPDYMALHPGLTAEQLEQATTAQRRLFRRNKTFAATLALREMGIAEDLPIWEYYYYGDVSAIGAFAPLAGYTDDDKGVLPELLDRGRREMEAVFHFLAEQHMDGRILEIVDNPGFKIEDRDGAQKEAHEEKWVRPRVINEGGVLKLRDLFETMFMISTSGGVKVPDLISQVANLGVFDELWESGCKDKREWQGFRKRRNKSELRQQSFFNIREWAAPLTYVKRLAGASGARKFLVGGEIQGQGKVPGTFNEPFDGLWKLRPKFFTSDIWNQAQIRQKVAESKAKLPQYKAAVQKILEEQADLSDLDPASLDDLVSTGGAILKNLILFMDHRDYVRNRASYAPKNWQYDNELMVRGFVIEFLKRKPVIANKGDLLSDGQIAKGGEIISAVGGEVLGDDHLGYAIQGRTKLAKALFQAILRTSSYHILDEADRRAVDGKAKVASEAMKKKRDELMKKILPAVNQPAIDSQKEGLKLQEQAEEKVIAEFAKLATEGKVDSSVRIEFGEKFKQVGIAKKQLEVAIAKSTNEAVEAELIRQFNAGDFTNRALLTSIAGRRQELANLNADPNLGNVELEINRLINSYVDMQLHKQFVGEWPARFAA